MRILSLLAFAANVVVTLISLAVLPARIAIHFGADGMANVWAPNYVNALLMTGTQVLLLCLLLDDWLLPYVPDTASVS